MSNRRDRLTTIVQILQVQNAATLTELAEKLSVSEMTIRRDLNLLSQDNIRAAWDHPAPPWPRPELNVGI